MIRSQVTVSSQTTSSPIPVSPNTIVDFSLGFGVDLAGGTMTYTVQYTFDNILSPGVTAVWFDHATATGKSANYSDGILFPVCGVRLNVTAYTSGTATLKVVQGD